MFCVTFQVCFRKHLPNELECCGSFPRVSSRVVQFIGAINVWKLNAKSMNLQSCMVKCSHLFAFALQLIV